MMFILFPGLQPLQGSRGVWGAARPPLDQRDYIFVLFAGLLSKLNRQPHVVFAFMIFMVFPNFGFSSGVVNFPQRELPQKLTQT